MLVTMQPGGWSLVQEEGQEEEEEDHQGGSGGNPLHQAPGASRTFPDSLQCVPQLVQGSPRENML